MRRDVPSLTAIRGVAAIYVVVHHLVEIYRWGRWSTPHTLTSMLFMGFTGVDLFFVLSGFILTIVHLEMRLGELGQFALRRVLRIYPLHLSFLAMMVCLGWFSIIWPRQSLDWSTLPLVGSLLQPYFGLDHGLWNSLSWSAGVELSCYVAFPLGLFMLRRSPAWVLAGIVGLCAYEAWRVQTHYAGFWTGLPALERGWSGFALGAAAGLLSARVSLRFWSASLLEFIGLGLIGWAVFSGQPPFVPLGSAALIFALKAQKGPCNWLLSLRPLVYLGEISFSIYLVQMLVIFGFNNFWPVGAYPAITPVFLIREALCLGALVAVSSVTYHSIERPGQRLWRLRAKQPAYAVAGQ